MAEIPACCCARTPQAHAPGPPPVQGPPPRFRTAFRLPQFRDAVATRWGSESDSSVGESRSSYFSPDPFCSLIFLLDLRPRERQICSGLIHFLVFWCSPGIPSDDAPLIITPLCVKFTNRRFKMYAADFVLTPSFFTTLEMVRWRMLFRRSLSNLSLLILALISCAAVYEYWIALYKILRTAAHAVLSSHVTAFLLIRFPVLHRPRFISDLLA